VEQVPAPVVVAFLVHLLQTDLEVQSTSLEQLRSHLGRPVQRWVAFSVALHLGGPAQLVVASSVALQ